MADETVNPDVEQEEVETPTEVQFPEHGEVVEGSDGKETIVHDTDEDGNVVGWHKELVEDK